MSDRENSPAYLALTPAGRRVLQLIEAEVTRCGGVAAISRLAFERSGISHAATGFGLTQVTLLGFVRIEPGPRRIGAFRLCDDWKSLDADTVVRQVRMAKLPMPPHTARTPQPVAVEQP